jgi:hypothetical protein
LEVFTKEGVWLAPEALLDQIGRGKFDPRRSDVLVTLSGSLTTDGGKPVLTLSLPDQSPVEFMIEPEPKSRLAKSLADEADKLSGRRVEIAGLWRPTPTEGPDRLLVRSLKEAPEPKRSASPGT